MLSSGRKSQTTRKKNLHPVCAPASSILFTQAWDSLPAPFPTPGWCRWAAGATLCLRHFALLAALAGACLNASRLSKSMFSTVFASAALPKPGTSKWAVTEKQLTISAAAGGSSELELYLLYAWETHGTTQGCALIHGQAEDRQGRCCINHSSLELENS